MSDIYDQYTYFDLINFASKKLNVLNGGKKADAIRVMKIGEEFGEAVQAYIGMTGQNPRKGITHVPADLMMELADVAITALIAMAHFSLTSNEAEAVFATKLEIIWERLDALSA